VARCWWRPRHSERRTSLSSEKSVSEATPAEIAEVERRYGQTIEELVAEAERGYDVTRLRVRVRARDGAEPEADQDAPGKDEPDG
jgi:hypothetical protein